MSECRSAHRRFKIATFNRYRWPLIFVIAAVAVGTGCGKFFPSASTLVAISVTPANPSIQLTKTQQFTATGTFGDSSSKDLTSSVTWSSSDQSKATINSSGLATAVATGTTTITASQSGVSGSTTLTVTTQTSGSLTISCSGCTGTGSNSFTAAAGSTLTFTAADSSNQAVNATWSSSNTTVANIGTLNGVAANVTAGTATITASANGATGSVTLTVQ